jgi:hypothetical protein
MNGSHGFKEKAAQRRLFNLNLMIVDQAAINAGFDFRRSLYTPVLFRRLCKRPTGCDWAKPSDPLSKNPKPVITMLEFVVNCRLLI